MPLPITTAPARSPDLSGLALGATSVSAHNDRVASRSTFMAFSNRHMKSGAQAVLRAVWWIITRRPLGFLPNAASGGRAFFAPCLDAAAAAFLTGQSLDEFGDRRIRLLAEARQALFRQSAGMTAHQ